MNTRHVSETSPIYSNDKFYQQKFMKFTNLSNSELRFSLGSQELLSIGQPRH
jgi:hypothetical protein